MELKDINLTQNPFQDIIPSSDGEGVWAGLKEQKKQITNIYSNAFDRNYRQVVLNWGPIGGGKTHAAFYFYKNKLRESGILDNQIVSVYVKIPKEGKGAGIQTVREIFDQIKVEKIIDNLNTLSQEKEENYIANELKKGITSSEAFIDSLVKLIAPKNNLFGNQEGLSQIFQKYIYDGISTADAKKLGIVRSLKTMNDYVSFLGLALKALTLGEQKHVFLWIDEMEDLLYYSGKEFKQYSQFIRDLTDSVNKNMTTFLNFTLTEGEEDSIKHLLGDAMWSRIDSKVRFRDLSVEDVVEYCTELISFYQVDKNSEFPLSEQVIEYIAKNIPTSSLIPREINKVFRDYIYFILENDVKKPTVNDVKKWQFERQSVT